VAQVHFVAEIDDFGYDTDYRVKPMPTLMAAMERERARVNAGGLPDASSDTSPSAVGPVSAEHTVPVAQATEPAPALEVAPVVAPAPAQPRPAPAPAPPAMPPTPRPMQDGAVRDHQVTERVHVSQELPAPKVVDAEREEAVVVEPLRVIRIVRLRQGDAVDEYRRVSHRYGQVMHFHNGAPCTQREFEQAVGD
jgi:hypothetical protein